MKNILGELWHGNISPQEDCRNNTPEMKQLMEYILVSEVTPLDKRTVLLSARIVNASTGKIVASSSVRTYADIDYLRPACNSLASKLVGAI